MDDYAVKVMLFSRESEYGWATYFSVMVQPAQTGETAPPALRETYRLDSPEDIGEVVTEMIKKAQQYEIPGLPGKQYRGLHIADSLEL